MRAFDAAFELGVEHRILEGQVLQRCHAGMDDPRALLVAVRLTTRSWPRRPATSVKRRTAPRPSRVRGSV